MDAHGRRGIVTGGTWCVDYNKVVSFWPQEDELAEYLGEERHGGGSGHNLAVDIRHLDPAMSVATITLVGDDDNGRFLMALADEKKIDRRQMHVVRDVRTQFTDAFSSQASGRRTHIFKRGSGDFLTPDHFDFEQTNARFLHLGLPGVHEKMDSPFSGDENGWVTVLKKARAAGLKTNLELASVGNELLVHLCPPCLPYLDFLIVNDTEIGAVSGMKTVAEGKTDRAVCECAAWSVLEKGAMEVVVVHFPSGAIAVTRSGINIFHPSVRVPRENILGSNGAGDAFAAGFLYAAHESWSLEQSLKLAHAAAAASLRSFSTTQSVEDWQKCLSQIAEWGWRD